MALKVAFTSNIYTVKPKCGVLSPSSFSHQIKEQSRGQNTLVELVY